MGTSRSGLEYAAKMARAGEAMREEAGHSTEAAAQIVKRVILAGTPARLRNFGKNGSPLGVGYRYVANAEGGQALVFARGRGWPILEHDTRPHAIPRLAGARSKTLHGPAFGGVNTKKLVSTPYGPRRSVWHPGTKAKRPFERGVERALPAIPIAYAARQRERLGRIF